MIKVKNILNVFIIPVGLILAGCTTNTGETDFSKIKPCKIYNNAVIDFNDKSYSFANEQLEALEENFPFSEIMDKSLFLAGKSYFLNDKFMEATERFKKFLKLYPKHERAVEAKFMLAMSYWYMAGTINRDITFLQMAKKEMQEFVKKHPKNANVESLKNKIKAIDNSFAKKEVDTAVYLLNDKDYSAAIVRLQTVLNQYGETDLAPETYYRLVEGYSSLNLFEEAEYFKKKLGEKYPDNKWNKEAEKWYKKIENLENKKD